MQYKYKTDSHNTDQEQESDFIYHVRRVSRAEWQEEWREKDKTIEEEFWN